MEKISVIVPIYNIEKYIDRCIRSVLEQSYNNIELILIDDGSADGSGRKCDFWKQKDSRIRVFHQVNQGVSSARNVGLTEAMGDYITFIDGDDWIEKNYLSNMYERIQRDNTDICISAGREVYENGEHIRNCLFDKECVLQYKEQQLYDWPFFTYVIHRLLIKRNLIDDLFFDTSLQNGEDSLYLTQLFTRAFNGISFSNYIGYTYLIRNNGAAVHNGYSQKKFSAIIAAEKRLQILEQSGVPMKKEWYCSFLIEAYRLYGFLMHNKEFYTTENAMILFTYLKKYRKYKSALGTSVVFGVYYEILLHSRILLERELAHRKVAHGKISGGD